MRARVAMPVMLAFALAWVRADASTTEPAKHPPASSAGATVRVYTPPLRLPHMQQARTLRVYLPPRYAQGDKRYPVLYMFDGQNLFDDATSYAGEWGVDEAMDALAVESGFEVIVVGIDHGGDARIHELIPYWNVRFVPNLGADFVCDIVDAIKPFIDRNYRTMSGREQTAVIGSSLGGLSADFAIHAHPDVFGKAGVFSPSYWVSEEALQVARNTALPPGSRIYLFMGGKEGAESVAKVEEMAAALEAHASTRQGVEARIDPDAEHNEAAWREAFPRAVRWLFDLNEPMRGARQRR